MPRSLIVEADGGSRGNPGPAAYGAVVRDAVTGVVLAELAGYLGEVSNNVAEYRGAIAGLEHAYEVDPEANVEMRLDSKLVVEQMSGRWQIKHPDMRDLARRARDVYPPGHVTYTWVPRSQNALADRLVNEMIDTALGGGSTHILRLDGMPQEDALAEDVVGSIDVERTRAVAEEQATSGKPVNVMVGWADLAAPTHTLLVRHGATELSLEKRFSGRGGFDAPLAPIGEEQAAAAAAELAERGDIQRIISSPLLRTRQTAQAISDALGLPIEIEQDFAECAFGEWDSHTFIEVRDRWPVELEEWLASTDVAPPGGESFRQCQERVLRARDRVVARYPGERLLIVAHVTPIKVLVGDAVGAPLTSLYRMELPPCSLTSLAWFPDGHSSMFSFAEAAHLRDVVTPRGV
ncbi:MAG: bifunctional RNase H/acid phosphatase [Actinomycetales bacterium]|nr:bifunctional RNase H/acid phosphatase [Actinomycetales bacterium]